MPKLGLMELVLEYPALVFLVSFGAMWAAAWSAALVSNRSGAALRLPEIFPVIETATLTLLALIIGFTFSMAVSRYDQRKNLEEAEANAIGTEYVRADLLGEPAAAAIRPLLRRYVAQRVVFYVERDAQQLAHIERDMLRLQAELWAAVTPAAAAQPTPLAAVAVLGMNDALNAEGYTQAAWWNRIPTAAWLLMAAIAVFANALVGYGTRRSPASALCLLVLPFLIATSFLLIADIDSPRGGIIRVVPHNLNRLAHSLGSQA